MLHMHFRRNQQSVQTGSGSGERCLGRRGDDDSFSWTQRLSWQPDFNGLRELGLADARICSLGSGMISQDGFPQRVSDFLGAYGSASPEGGKFLQNMQYSLSMHGVKEW